MNKKMENQFHKEQFGFAVSAVLAMIIAAIVCLLSACAGMGNADVEYGQSRLTSVTGFTMAEFGYDAKNNMPTGKFPSYVSVDLVQNAPNTETVVDRQVPSLWQEIFGGGQASKFIYMKTGDSTPYCRLDNVPPSVQKAIDTDPEFAAEIASQVKRIRLSELKARYVVQDSPAASDQKRE